MALYEPLWPYMAPYGSISSSAVAPYGAVRPWMDQCGPMAPYMSIWIYMAPYGPMWLYRNLYGPLWPYMAL